ncbi:MAG TPA: hypothetical protein VHE55_05085 [Fimbriimonadaceae bacterium]|nr:hypothetical protein [Fimbriimonadaceae bacterium]
MHVPPLAASIGLGYASIVMRKPIAQLSIGHIVVIVIVFLMVSASYGQVGSQGSGSSPGGGSSGSWQILYKPSGTTHWTVDGQSNQFAWGIGSQWQPTCVFPMSPSGTIAPGDNANVSASGSIQVQISWTGNPSSAPEMAWVAVTSSTSWSGDSGDCNNGYNDQPKSIGVPPSNGQSKKGIHVLGFPYSGSPITFTVGLSANCSASTVNVSYGTSLAFSVAPTDKNATLSRTDGVVIKPLADGSYAADTLLTWGGVLAGDTSGTTLDYDQLYDGGPGATRDTLRGVFAGSWIMKMFTDPNTNLQQKEYAVDVTWSGGIDPSTDHFYPPTPLMDVHDTTYTGMMPAFDMPTKDNRDQDPTPKKATWGYHLQEKPDDGSTPTQLDLKWVWTAHYVAESWALTGTERTEIDCPNPPRGVYLDADNQSGMVGVPDQWTWDAGDLKTDWGYVETSNIHFHIHRWHIGVALFRNEIGEQSSYSYTADGPLNWTVTYNPGQGPGVYTIMPKLVNLKKSGTLDIWNAQGIKAPTTAWIVPCDSWSFTFEPLFLGNSQP